MTEAASKRQRVEETGPGADRYHTNPYLQPDVFQSTVKSLPGSRAANWADPTLRFVTELKKALPKHIQDLSNVLCTNYPPKPEFDKSALPRLRSVLNFRLQIL